MWYGMNPLAQPHRIECWNQICYTMSASHYWGRIHQLFILCWVAKKLERIKYRTIWSVVQPGTGIWDREIPGVIQAHVLWVSSISNGLKEDLLQTVLDSCCYTVSSGAEESIIKESLMNDRTEKRVDGVQDLDLGSLRKIPGNRKIDFLAGGLSVLKI